MDLQLGNRLQSMKRHATNFASGVRRQATPRNIGLVTLAGATILAGSLWLNRLDNSSNTIPFTPTTEILDSSVYNSHTSSAIAENMLAELRRQKGLSGEDTAEHAAAYDTVQPDSLNGIRDTLRTNSTRTSLDTLPKDTVIVSPDSASGTPSSTALDTYNSFRDSLPDTLVVGKGDYIGKLALGFTRDLSQRLDIPVQYFHADSIVDMLGRGNGRLPIHSTPINSVLNSTWEKFAPRPIMKDSIQVNPHYVLVGEKLATADLQEYIAREIQRGLPDIEVVERTYAPRLPKPKVSASAQIHSPVKDSLDAAADSSHQQMFPLSPSESSGSTLADTLGSTETSAAARLQVHCGILCQSAARIYPDSSNNISTQTSDSISFNQSYDVEYRDMSGYRFKFTNMPVRVPTITQSLRTTPKADSVQVISLGSSLAIGSKTDSILDVSTPYILPATDVDQYCQRTFTRYVVPHTFAQAPSEEAVSIWDAIRKTSDAVGVITYFMAEESTPNAVYKENMCLPKRDTGHAKFQPILDTVQETYGRFIPILFDVERVSEN